jgi:hypothetical protein
VIVIRDDYLVYLAENVDIGFGEKTCVGKEVVKSLHVNKEKSKKVKR